MKYKVFTDVLRKEKNEKDKIRPPWTDFIFICIFDNIVSRITAT